MPMPIHPEPNQPRSHYPHPILGIGLVNLTSHKVAKAAWHQWGKVWDCWKEGEGTNFLVCQKHKATFIYKIIHTSGLGDWVPGDVVRLSHDQSGREIPGEWLVVQCSPHTAEGLALMRERCLRGSVRMYTFK